MNKTNETILRILGICIAVLIGLEALKTAILIGMALNLFSVNQDSAAQLLAH